MQELLFSNQGILILVSVVSVWLMILSFFLLRLSQHYSRLTTGVTKKDLKSVLDKILTRIEENKGEVDKLNKKTELLEKEGKLHLQKIGFMRYNPFKTTGGDQSFVFSVTDAYDNGVVINSLHSRETTRVYAKKVKEGKEDKYEFSEEEKKVIKEAIKGTSRQTR